MHAPLDLDALHSHVATLDMPALRKRFVEDNELLVVEHFLPEPLTEQLRERLPDLDTHIHRNFIPGHKKGGSISRFELDALAPYYHDLYDAAALRDFLARVVAEELHACPQGDPHTYALYYYTEPGDHIGYHYDTSYYKGQRYTVLIGLVDESSCHLACQLYKDLPDRETQQLDLKVTPGTLVLFNGDKLYHSVTPLGADERRVILTMEYVTNTEMAPWRRFVSSMKDAIAYFGFKQVFGTRGH